MKSFLILWGVLFLSQCTSVADYQTGDRPDENAIIGRGRGVSQEIADENARNEIGKYFSVRIKSKVVSSEFLNQTNDESSDSSSVDSQITAESDAILQGVEIIKRWQEGVDYHAVAKLDKTKAKRIFKSIMSEMDKKDLTAYRQCCLENRGSPLLAIMLIKKLISARQERAIVANQYNVVHGGSASVGNPLPISVLLKKRSALVKLITIFIDAPKELPTTLETKLKSLITDNQLLLSPDKGKATHILKVNYQEEPVKSQLKDWTFLKINLSIELVNKQNGRMLTSELISKKGSGLDAAGALRNATSLVAKEIKSTFVNMATSL